MMVTAFASIELAVDAMRLGATDFLRKPMTPEMLRGAVAAALASRPRVPLKHPGPVEAQATPHIEAVARVVRLTRHPLQPGGAFWREQAERLLSAYLWSEGKVPEGGQLTVQDISRDDIDVAAAWDRD